MEAGAFEHDGDRLDNSFNGAVGTAETGCQSVLGDALLNFELLLAATTFIDIGRHRSSILTCLTQRSFDQYRLGRFMLLKALNSANTRRMVE